MTRVGAVDRKHGLKSEKWEMALSARPLVVTLGIGAILIASSCEGGATNVKAPAGPSTSVASVPSTTATTKPTVTTPAYAAPLQGSFSVQVKMVQVPGQGATGEVGLTETDTWTFDPKCGEAGCDVVASGYFAGHSFQISLTRTGSQYAGKTTAHITHCGALPGIPGTGAEAENTISIQITGPPTEAWASWTGTMVIDAPETPNPMNPLTYCPAQRWTTALSATR